MKVLSFAVFLFLYSCSNHSGHHSSSDKIINDSSNLPSSHIYSAPIDSLEIQKDELTEIYTQAIAEFIKAAYIKDKTTFDTLYFGKRSFGQADDFPDITLPLTIENIQIRLVDPELGQLKQIQQKSLVYVNMVGWIDHEKAEFVFVVFTNGGVHQYDYFINFIHIFSTNKFELDRIEFENYLNLNGEKPKKIIVYQDGKYMPNK